MILLGISGGVDSMYLAHKTMRSGTPFAAAHCHFGLRGADSDADEALVRAWCEEHGIRLHVKRFDTVRYAREQGISIEMAARELRYRWFGELCRTHGYEALAVAHHADDNAETLLLNLLRGTGLKGLCGMKAEGRIPDLDYADIPLLRPLLGMTREEIAAQVAAEGIPYREDRTNAENGCKRNILRNKVFPLLREINPSFVRTLSRDMQRFSEACDALEQTGIPGLSPGQGRETAVPESPTAPAMLPPLQYTVEELPWDGSMPLKQPAGTLILDAERIGGEPVFGPWEPGDWLRPFGMHGRKKVQDWFSDRHWTPGRKRQAVLLRHPSEPGHILAIVGEAIDDSVKVTSQTKQILKITVIN